MMWLLAAWLSDRAQFRLGAGSYGSAYNGVGCVDAVNARTALAPMAYRVLVPWLIGLAEHFFPRLQPRRVEALYEPAKILLMALAFWTTAQALGPARAWALVALLPTTFLFDYWDTYPELAAFAGALTGNFPLALGTIVLAALSRETAPLAALTWGLATGDWFGALSLALMAGILMGLVRLWAGRKALYCSRLALRWNREDLGNLFKNHPFYLAEIAMTLAVTALTVGAVVAGKAGPAWPVPLVLLAAGWALGRAIETRIFAPCLLWIVMAF